MHLHAKIVPQFTRQQHYDGLLAGCDGSVNRVWLAQMTASWLAGESVLPDRLGLNADQFQTLCKWFNSVDLPEQAPSGNTLDFSRMLEKQDLEQLLRQFATPGIFESEWLVAIIVAACLGSDHLWHDLGLWSRKELSAMLLHNFPELASRNVKDMKWKKFLYKQLCEAEGLHLCRAPSCEVCQDYSNCFGPEE